MADSYSDVVRQDTKLKRRQDEWGFRAEFFHDIELPPRTWAVDGVVQIEDLTHAALFEAVNNSEGRKPVVTVSAPLHIELMRITGFGIPYKHAQRKVA